MMKILLINQAVSCFIAFLKVSLPYFKQKYNYKYLIAMKKLKHLSVVAMAGMMLVACGQNKKEEQVSSAQETETVTVADETATSQVQDTIEVELNAEDTMKFDKNEIRVHAGQQVRLTLNHVGKLQKSSMGHNFVLLSQGTDVNAFATKAVQEGKAPDFEVPESLLTEVIAHTKTIGGGESVTIEFTAPEAGTYDYICSFPGHASMMNGKLIVE